MITLEEAMADWRRVAMTCQPDANADFVRVVCENVVNRARLLSGLADLRFPDVAAFLLLRSRAWILGGLPVGDLIDRLPQTLGDLGMMKLAEGGEDGEPLSVVELQRAMRHKRRIIH